MSKKTAFLLLAFLLVGIVLWLVIQGPNLIEQAPRDAVVDAFPTLDVGEEAILFGGDVLWANDYRRFTKEHGLDYPARRVLPLIKSANAVAFVANHEGPITKEKKRCPPVKNWNYRSRTRNRKVLPKIGFTHLSMANNHALDRCAKGMNDTFDYLEEVGIIPFGAGANLNAARKAPIIEAGGARVSIIGGMESWAHYRKADWGATDERAGVFLLNRKDIPEAFATARRESDFVVAFPHWGANYKPVNRHQRRLAKRLVDAGADLVIGHHGHAAQEIGMFEGKPLIWGLGNLFFGTPGRFGHDKMQPGYGLLARLVIKNGGLDRIEIVPIMLNNRLVEFQPRLCTIDESEEVLQGLISKDEKKIEIRDGIAIFRPGTEL